MRPALLLYTLLLSALPFPAGPGDEFCGIRNTSFVAGETIAFKVFYSVAGAYFEGGDALFQVNLEQLNGKAVYHITASGKTNSLLDIGFKVRDKYQTYIDTGTLQPYKFIRDVSEGGYKKYENVSFLQTVGTAISDQGVFKIPKCVQDVLSSIFYARNIDFDKYKPQDKIPFSMFLDNQVYSLYIRYLGKEIIKTRYGKFRAIKFRPLLIKGTIFEGGEKMTVWVSDDANHIPLRAESPITVGKISADMMSYHNLRYRLSSLLSVR
ncbi:MAG TPA: DUF3108 domain-containing protein [Puia sp.]|jgi:hypothetical protein